MPVRWTAPEALGEQKFSQQSDCWSFGVLLYEIWTKAAIPYGDWSNQRVWSEVTSGFKLASPAGCPEEVYELMQSCWYSPGHRPPFDRLARSLRTLEVEFGQPQPTNDALQPMRSSIQRPAAGEYVDFFSKTLPHADETAV